MRDLEDCKAEVFRRSEERIKERKRKRNRVLACCIPLCLLLVAGGLYIRPLLEPVDDMGGLYSGGTNRIPDRVLGGLDYELHSSVTAYSSVTITDRTGSKEVSRKVTDGEALGELCGFMAMYFDMSGTTVKEEMADGADGASAGKPLFGSAVGDTIREELEEKYGLEEPLADYKLIFRRSTGEELKLRLYGNYLYNEKDGCEVTLSDDQLAVLKTQLEQAVVKVD